MKIKANLEDLKLGFGMELYHQYVAHLMENGTQKLAIYRGYILLFYTVESLTLEGPKNNS